MLATGVGDLPLANQFTDEQFRQWGKYNRLNPGNEVAVPDDIVEGACTFSYSVGSADEANTTVPPHTIFPGLLITGH